MHIRTENARRLCVRNTVVVRDRIATRWISLFDKPSYMIYIGTEEGSDE